MNQGQQPPQVQQGQQPPPPVVVFARTPATFQQNQLLNYAEKRDVEIYNKGSAALSGEQWDGKSVHALMVRVGERAGQYGWMPMLTFGARNLVTGYGDITREEVRGWQQLPSKRQTIAEPKTAICCSAACQHLSRTRCTRLWQQMRADTHLSSEENRC